MKRSGEEAEADSSINLARTLMLLSRGESSSTSPTSSSSSSGGGGRVFECRTCDRQFPSFQALGGHRASHKKLKMLLGHEQYQGGQGQEPQSATPPPPQRPKVHECPICGLEFSMGQALGGHMRRHRTGFVEKKSTSNGKRVMLDLNLPPLEEAMEDGTKLGVGLALGLGLVYR